MALEIDDSYMGYKGAGDWLFWIKMALKGNVSYVNEELNKYRLHNNTTSSVVRSGVEFHEMKSIYSWLLTHGLLSSEQFKECRKSNLLLIMSLKEIPSIVRRELLRMWDASPLYVLYLFIILNYFKFKSLIAVCLIKKIRS